MIPFKIASREFLAQDEFRKIEGTELYEISPSGIVRSVKIRVLKNGTRTTHVKNLKICFARKYPSVTLYINKKFHTCSIHRLIALTFIPNPDNKQFVNHKDGNKLNNNIDNLEWVTPRENNVHAVQTGLIKSGLKSIKSKLTEAQVIAIFHDKRYQRAIAKAYGISQSCVKCIKRKETYKEELLNIK